MIKRALVAVGLVSLAMPGVIAYAHSWKWAWSVGAGITAGLLAAALMAGRPSS